MSWTTLPTVGGIEIIGPSGEPLALFYYTGGTFTAHEYDRVLAYARMAAAAPAMWEALKRAESVCRKNGTEAEVLKAMQAALAKAEGR